MNQAFEPACTPIAPPNIHSSAISYNEQKDGNYV